MAGADARLPSVLSPPLAHDVPRVEARVTLPHGLSYRGRAVLAWCLVLMDGEGEVSRVELMSAMGFTHEKSLSRSMVDLEGLGLACRILGPSGTQRIRVVLGRIYTTPATCETCAGPLGAGPDGARSCQRCVAAVLRRDRTWRAKVFDSFVTSRASGLSESASVYRAHAASGAPLYSESGDRDVERGSKLSERRAVVPLLLTMGLLKKTHTWWEHLTTYRSGEHGLGGWGE